MLIHIMHAVLRFVELLDYVVILARHTQFNESFGRYILGDG